jgi:predicted DNA-binding WGR domain protein
MRLIKKVSLFFNEGNSDKVYEIDLCDIGNERYVVNFRYGRRGSTLKEGTKTETAVELQKAESIFNSLEAEKRGKGYRASGEPVAAVPASFTPAPVTIAIPQIDWSDWQQGREKAIMKRLQLAVEGKENTAKHFWRTSRIIWMAGVLKIEAAAPFIIHLANKADAMQQYAAAWTLGRIKSTDAISLFQSYFRSAQANLKRIGGEALLHVLNGDEQQKHLAHFKNSLPEPIRLAVEGNNPEQLDELLQEPIVNQTQPQYPVLEDLYAIAIEHKWVKQVLRNILLQLPLKPNYFKHIRHIYKLAEFRDDFEILGVLSCKFERETEMFRQKKSAYGNPNIYLPSLEEGIDPKKELQKKTSRLAYSNKTRQYLRNRTLRNLNNYGKFDDLNYVRMATGLLLSYDNERDFAKAYDTSYYEFRNGRYQQMQRRFPANAHAVYFNQILFGNSKELYLRTDNRWAYADDQQSSRRQTNEGQKSSGQEGGGIIKKIFSLFGGKKKEIQGGNIHAASTYNVKPRVQINNTAPYIELWNKLPQAYVQLLIHGRMNEVHQFAVTNLQAHPEYSEIKQKIDNKGIELLLTSLFDIPADFGYKLALEKYDPAQPDAGLVKALFYSRLPAARETAMKWVVEKPERYFEDSEFVSALLFCPHAEIRKWVSEEISTRNYTPTQAELICGRVITAALTTKQNTELNNRIIDEAGETIIRIFSSQLASIGLHVVEDLIKHHVASSQVLGLKILLLKKEKINYDELSNEVFNSLLNNTNQPVRIKTFELLQELSTNELLKRQELMINCCVAPFHDVRINIRPIIKRMAEQDAGFGTNAVNYLMPYLMRKETSEGLQQDVSDLLKNELIGYINNAEKETVLRLVYSQYVPAQEFGIAILEKYIDPAGFTIRQIIAFGNHETLAVREWCRKYFTNNIARIKFEREEAIRLLDAKWDDTRDFAKSFFRDNFSENDWSTETLVGIADSVRPDIEAFGRELITKFFTDKDGEEYLLRLSQHPGEKMQLFATNYLERFATGNIKKIGALEFYFSSVLSRVNKARVAKNRVFQFLLNEGKKTEEAARIINKIISNISATVSIDDKAKCIEIMYELGKLYKLEQPMVIQEVEERAY